MSERKNGAARLGYEERHFRGLGLPLVIGESRQLYRLIVKLRGGRQQPRAVAEADPDFACPCRRRPPQGRIEDHGHDALHRHFHESQITFDRDLVGRDGLDQAGRFVAVVQQQTVRPALAAGDAVQQEIEVLQFGRCAIDDAG